VGVDVGGTFTDVVLEHGARRHTAKILTDHRAPEQGVLEGMRAVISRAGLGTAAVKLVIHGTTLATNALIERRGARTALVTTEGFRDVIEMGTESRFDQYDLDISKPAALVPRWLRFTVAGRLDARGAELRPLDVAALERICAALIGAGVESVAIAFLHSYANPAHELAAAEIIESKMPGVAFSLSSQVSPEIREYERFTTTCANAFVQPLVAAYLERLEQNLRDAGYSCPLYVMLSNGGITEPAVARRFPVRLIESGPAGGAILACHIAERSKLDRVVSFDMGGTTAKVCLIDGARPRTSRMLEIARGYRFKPGSGLPLRIPSVELVEIGAGGGSIAGIDTLGRVTVGPESAGSEPGPACYGRGGSAATVTDADVVLGRIGVDEFAGGTIGLDADRARRALDGHLAAALGTACEYAAFAVTEVIDENMANAAREHATEHGKSLAGRTMIAFGGSAPIHAARIAEKLQIDCIVVPVGAGVGSAVGFLRAPISYEVSRTAYQRLNSFDPEPINRMLAEMAAEARAVVATAAPGAPRQETRLAYMRYVGQGHEIPVPVPDGRLTPAHAEELRKGYDAIYKEQYGRALAHVDVEIVSWTLAVSAPVARQPQQADPPDRSVPEPGDRRAVFDPSTGASRWLPIYRRGALPPGARIRGPAFITEADTTTVLSDSFDARINAYGDIVLLRLRDT
jgi:N-methylhydantoinase A